jgi:hypothetical protein
MEARAHGSILSGGEPLPQCRSASNHRSDLLLLFWI